MDATHIGRLARLLVAAGVLVVASVSLSASREPTMTPVAFAGVAQQDNGNDNNDDPTNSDSEDRILRGQVVELWGDLTPPEILVAVVRDERIWARVYNDQIQRTGLNNGDHVRLRGEYDHGVFQAYEIDVTDRCCPPPNHNGNDND